MEKHTRTRFLILLSVKIFISFFILGLIRYTVEMFLDDMYGIEIAYKVLSTINVLLIIIMIAIGAYFIYLIYQYGISLFYKKTKIPVHHAIFHGYLDLAYVYDRLKIYDVELIIDTKNKAIIVKKGETYLHVLIRDYFGKLKGEARDSTWYLVSKRKKEYGRIQYKKRIPVMNPILENKAIINELTKQTGISYLNYVVLTGVRHNTFQNEHINTVYELEYVIRKIKK